MSAVFAATMAAALEADRRRRQKMEEDARKERDKTESDKTSEK